MHLKKGFRTQTTPSPSCSIRNVIFEIRFAARELGREYCGAWHGQASGRTDGAVAGYSRIGNAIAAEIKVKTATQDTHVAGRRVRCLTFPPSADHSRPAPLWVSRETPRASRRVGLALGLPAMALALAGMWAVRKK